jgi:hypothetical protein
MRPLFPLAGLVRLAPWMPRVSGAQVNRFDNAEGVEHGSALFQNHCTYCHGAPGQGGRGSDLTTSECKYGGSGKELYVTIRNGGRETEMPVRPSPESASTRATWRCSWVCSHRCAASGHRRDHRGDDGQRTSDVRIPRYARYGHGKACVALPHDSAAGESEFRNVGAGYQQSLARLLRRFARRRQSLSVLSARARSRHRQIEAVLPVRAKRYARLAPRAHILQ